MLGVFLCLLYIACKSDELYTISLFEILCYVAFKSSSNIKLFSLISGIDFYSTIDYAC